MRAYLLITGDDQGLRGPDDVLDQGALLAARRQALIDSGATGPGSYGGPDPDFAAEIIWRRKALGLSQVAFARAMGYSQAHISSIESGRRYASIDAKAKMRVQLDRLENRIDASREAWREGRL